MPTSIAATMGIQPRPPLADPAPQQGEAYGNIKREWLLMGPWEHAKEGAARQGPCCDAVWFRGRVWEPGV